MRRATQVALSDLGWDCLTTEQASNKGQSDAEQLEWAFSAERCIFTSNQRDFARLHREWANSGRRHFGIIILTDQRAPAGSVVRSLEAISRSFDSESIRGQILFLGNWM